MMRISTSSATSVDYDRCSRPSTSGSKETLPVRPTKTSFEHQIKNKREFIQLRQVDIIHSYCWLRRMTKKGIRVKNQKRMRDWLNGINGEIDFRLFKINSPSY